ncbi:OsmC family protein [Ruania suaedae]|uniref:OsmC family protein n=1 Tax=Ruania suaedae TaxID=2897774 RepID=UPI001E28D8E9|nr:OsmC family protein [Ruania suaedae]UFU03968.1 OsmC family protein [Ruania suaedae]
MADEQAGLSAARTGPRSYVARNARGGEVRVGSSQDEGAFTPGELLALALATCTLMSAEWPLSRRLGEDFAATATVTTRKDAQANRYVAAAVELALDTSGLTGTQREELSRVLERAAASACTVGRTLEAGLPHRMSIGHQPDAP